MHWFKKWILQPVGWILGVARFVISPDDLPPGGIWQVISGIWAKEWVQLTAFGSGLIILSYIYGTALYQWKVAHQTETLRGYLWNYFLDGFLPKIIPSRALAKRRRGLKRLLGTASREAQFFKTTIIDARTDRRPRFAGWAEHKRAMIAAALGEGEAARFTDDIGLVFRNGEPWPEFKNYIDGRIFRIGQLIERADTLDVDRSFNPDDEQWRKEH
jgi:hypothetical protein